MRSQPKIIASFDDGTVEDLKAAELMKKHKIETVFYWPVYPEHTNEMSDRTSLNVDQMQELAKEFTIGSHTISHALLTRIPLGEAQVEISQSRKLLQDMFNQPIESFCYPRGYSNPEIQQAVAEAGYTNARSTIVGYIHESENPFFEQTAVHLADRKEYGGQDWFTYGLKLFEEAKKTPGSVFHFWGHSWEIEQNSDWWKLEDFLERITN